MQFPPIARRQRRRELEMLPSGPVKVTILHEGSMRIAGCVLEVSGRRVKLSLPEPVAIGAAIRLDVEGAIVLAEVCDCVREPTGFAVDLQVEHVLRTSHLP